MGVSYSLLIYIQAVQSLGEDKQQKRIIQRLFYETDLYFLRRHDDGNGNTQ